MRRRNLKERSSQPRLYSLDTAAEMARLPRARLVRWVRVGLLQPRQRQGQKLLFGEPELYRLRRIRRLSEDMGLNLAGIEIAMRLLDEIETLRAALERKAG